MNLLLDANLKKVSALAAQYGEHAKQTGLSGNPTKHTDLENICSGLPAGHDVRNAVYTGFKVGYARA